MKYEESRLVECGTYLPFKIKMKCDEVFFFISNVALIIHLLLIICDFRFMILLLS